jgi:pimeloyl-ACP methyl ester carboxylesterase
VTPEPFQIRIPQEELDDLRSRLAMTRWPADIEGSGWDYGADAQFMRQLVDYWRTAYDWRATEAYINSFPNYRVELHDMRVHYIHVRGNGPAPLPLLLTHGWPSTFYEMLHIIPMLTDPARYGGDPADAFDVVVPAVPGYAFSDQPRRRGFTNQQTAEIFHQLMLGLGYPRFALHTYDIGRSIMTWLITRHPDAVIGYHTSEPGSPAPYLGPGSPPLSDAEREHLEYARQWQADEGGYMALQRSRPHTVGFGLNDSPVGLAAWIVEKWFAWTEPPDGDLLAHINMDDLLANITLYWLSGTIGSANRLYYEGSRGPAPLGPDDRIHVPFGVTRTMQRIERPPREYVERVFTDLRRWEDFPRGGHFIAIEEPAMLADALREFFRPMRH